MRVDYWDRSELGTTSRHYFSSSTDDPGAAAGFVSRARCLCFDAGNNKNVLIALVMYYYCAGGAAGAEGRLLAGLGRIKVEPHVSVNEHHCIVIIFIERITEQGPFFVHTESVAVDEGYRGSPLDNSGVVALCAPWYVYPLSSRHVMYRQTFTNTREYRKDPVLITTTTRIASTSDQLFYVVTLGIKFIRRSR